MAASIEKGTVSSGGVRSQPEHLFSLNVAPLDALDPMLAERFALDAPLLSKQTFAYTDQQILNGMYLNIRGRRYPIKGVAAYPDESNTGFVFYQLIVEDIVSA